MGRYDDDADDTPSGSKYSDDAIDTPEDDSPEEGVKAPTVRRVIKRGWGNAEETRQADSPFAQRLKVTNDAVVVKFLEDDPYTSFRQHWIERQGQKSFTCIAEMHAKGCPLCAAGDRPSARFNFNVALLSEDGEPLLKSYEVGPRVIDQLKNIHQDTRSGPLSRHYYAVSRSGKGATSQTNHQMVKADDLDEDWELEPLTDDQLKDLQSEAYTEDIVSIPSYKTLQTLAAEELGV